MSMNSSTFSSVLVLIKKWRRRYGASYLCCREYYTSRAYPESLCEGQFCEEAEDGFADEHNIKLED